MCKADVTRCLNFVAYIEYASELKYTRTTTMLTHSHKKKDRLGAKEVGDLTTFRNSILER